MKQKSTSPEIHKHVNLNLIVMNYADKILSTGKVHTHLLTHYYNNTKVHIAKPFSEFHKHTYFLYRVNQQVAAQRCVHRGAPKYTEREF